MRVRISYETDFDKVPVELSTLIAKAQNQYIQKVGQDLADIFEELQKEESPNLSLAVEGVNKARKQLFEADSLLADVTSILAGYQRAQVNPDSLESAPQTQVEPDSPESDIETAAPSSQVAETDETLQTG